MVSVIPPLKPSETSSSFLLKLLIISTTNTKINDIVICIAKLKNPKEDEHNLLLALNSFTFCAKSALIVPTSSAGQPVSIPSSIIVVVLEDKSLPVSVLNISQDSALGNPDINLVFNLSI